MSTIKGFGQAWTSAEEYTGNGGDKPTLPPRGAYALKIINAGVKELPFGSALRVQFDITEGEHKYYFRRKYDYNKAYNDQNGQETTWSGKYDMTLPLDRHSEYLEKNMRSLKTFFGVVNKCNGTNFSLENDFDPARLKGMKFYGMFTYGTYNGNAYIEFRYPLTADQASSDGLKIPNDRAPRGNAVATSTADSVASAVQGGEFGDFEEIISVGEVPF